MSDPFKIIEPTCISFSGGRTSAYMLWRVLQSNGGLPDEAIVCFANTGKEDEATLKFVHDCETQWNVPIVWLEYAEAEESKDRFKVVTYETASRNGEPFEAMIARKKFLPNSVMRFCTTELKITPIARYMESIGHQEFETFAGIRADEPKRIVRLRQSLHAPLAKIGVDYTQTAVAQRPFIEQAFAGTSATTYAVSVNIESTDGVLTNNQVLAISGLTPTFFANGVSVSTGAVAIVGRLTAVFTAAATATYYARFGIGGSGAATGTIRFSCPQVEAGAFATSYIPTVASQVTRAADSASMIGNNFARWFNQTAGTFYFDSTFNGTTASLQRLGISVSDGTTSNRITSVLSSGTVIRNIISVGGAAQADMNSTVASTFNTSNKNAVAYAVNDFATTANGLTPQTDTSGAVPVVNQAWFGQSEAGGSTLMLNGTIKRIAYYNRRLSNTELQAITS